MKSRSTRAKRSGSSIASLRIWPIVTGLVESVRKGSIVLFDEALLNHKRNEVVSVHLPNGKTRDLKITKIEVE